MDHKRFIRGLIGVTTAAAAVFSALSPFSPVSVYAEGQAAETRVDAVQTDTEALPDRIMNGDFEWPKVESIVGNLSSPHDSYTVDDTTYTIEQGDGTDISFQTNNPWLVTSTDIFDHASRNETPSHDGFYWQTTSSDGRVELETDNASNIAAFWHQGSPVSKPNAASRDQFAELVAEERASLYQNISTEPGSVLSWSLMHRARYTEGNNGNDTMALFIGPMQQGSLKKKDSDTASEDLFMAMAQLLVPNYNDLQPNNQLTEQTVYSKPITEETTVIDDSLVSKKRTNEHTQEWKCWIITDSYEDWVQRAGTYTVPAGQDATTFAFTPLTAATQSSNTYNRGNCLDNITFAVQYPLIVTAMDGVKGTINGGGISNATAAENNAYTGRAEKDSTVTINIGLKDDYLFMGAEINGDYKTPENKAFFKKNEDGSYTLTLTMDEAKNVHLMCSRIAEVYYDPNGGKLPEGMNDTYEFANLNDEVIQKLPPSLSGNTFRHWEVFASNGEDSHHITVSENHTITYDNVTHTFTLADNATGSNEHIKLEENADKYAILLRAVYTHTVTVQPCTKHVADSEVSHDDDAGGTVSVSVSGEQTDTDGDDKTAQVDQGTEFTVKADPKPGYKVVSWWYEYENDNGDKIGPIQIPSGFDNKNGTYTARFNGSRDFTIHVQFEEAEITPNLSVVAQDEEAAEKLSEKGIATGHGTVSGTDYSNAAYGGKLYGNTIATGFFTEREFDGSSQCISGVWTVKVPVSRTFIKVPDEEIVDGKPDAKKYPHLQNDVGIADSAPVQYNSGAIYKASGEDANREFRFYTENNTVITTDGSVVFGLIIDNLYAPNATAGFKETNDTTGVDGTLDGSNSVYTDQGDTYVPTELYSSDGASQATYID